MRMPEIARYMVMIAGDEEKAATDMSKVLNVKIAVDQARVEAIARSGTAFDLFFQRVL